MARIIGLRFLGSLGAVFGATILAFLIMRVLPGNPARLILGPLATEHAVTSLNHQIGLDRPLYVQYWRYISSFFQGNWGYSYSDGAGVKALIAERAPATIELALFSFALAMISAVGLALLSTYRHRPITDRIVRGASYLGFGTPPFFLALLLLVFFFKTFHLLPGPEGRLSVQAIPPPEVTGLYTVDALLAGQLGTFWAAVEHLILPSLALGISSW